MKKIPHYLMKKPHFAISLILLAIVTIALVVPAQVRAYIQVMSKSGESLYLYKDYHALVVGVGDYDYWPDLQGAIKDAREVAEYLKKAGMKVKLVSNPTSKQLKRSLNQLTYNAGKENNRAILFFYSGHGETESLERSEAPGRGNFCRMEFYTTTQ